ncbi:protein ELC [Daucus carota subsp. sativus]|nr:PREDICTED: protein ELC [Daucus carota subsp. sativus]
MYVIIWWSLRPLLIQQKHIDNFTMSSTSSIQFIDGALSCTSPFALSYTDPYKKLLIRKHLILLLQNFPSFRPSVEAFTHNNGNIVNLLFAAGELHVSNSTVPINLTIWLHEDYPNTPPIVFVSSNLGSQIQQDHPFVDPSGSTLTPYLQTWLSPPCNLLDLVRNFVKLFSLVHPFNNSSTFASIEPSLVSRRQAMDRLSCGLHYDMMALRTESENDIEYLSTIQAEMVKRVDVTKYMIVKLEAEKRNLKKKVKEMTEEADVVMNWIKAHDHDNISANNIEDVFETADDESQVVLECAAADLAIEDLMYALDKAVEEEVMSFDLYIKQVRSLAREQFFHRAKLVKLNAMRNRLQN